MCDQCWQDEKARRVVRQTPTPTRIIPEEPLELRTSRPGLRWITGHLAWLAEQRLPRFFLQTFFEKALCLAAGTTLVLLLGLPPRTDLAKMSDTSLVWLVVVVAPITETGLFQGLFGALGRTLRLGTWPQIALVWAPFALAHFLVGAGTGICAGVIGGFWLAYAYVGQRRHSFARAYFVTAGLHAATNSTIVLLQLLVRHHALAGPPAP
jgi:hypothetical protein